jgi:hypothetical protein
MQEGLLQTSSFDLFLFFFTLFLFGIAGFVTIVGSRYMILVVNSETRIHTVDSQNTQAYYAAEAGMENMMA